MNQTTLSVAELITKGDNLLIAQREQYLSAAANINMRYRKLLQNNFGATLMKNCVWDMADTLASRYFNTTDFYLSPQQLYERIVHFSYEDNPNSLNSDAALRKLLYENESGKDVLADIKEQAANSQVKLFDEARNRDRFDRQKSEYRKQRETSQTVMDDITGRSESSYVRIKNGKQEKVSNLHVDHVLSRESITYNSRYISPERLDDLRRFYNSGQNYWLIHASANTSKGDVRVCEVNGQIIYMAGNEFRNKCQNGELSLKNDITWKASAEQLADATISMWEKSTPSGKKIQTLKDAGYLDENGKILPNAKDKLIQTYRKALDSESLEYILPHREKGENGTMEWHPPAIMYKNVVRDAGVYTKQSIGKIVVGQVVYYALPPLVFEVQEIIKKRNMKLDRFFDEIKKARKRLEKYIMTHLGEIFRNILGHTAHKFIRTFFDIIISLVKETVRRLVRIVKQLILSLVNCVRIIANKESSAAQKADSVTKIFASSINIIVLEILFEYAEKQFGLPDFLMEPLQIIATVLTTNLTMLWLQKLDLFDVQYGFLVANMDRIFEEERDQYRLHSEELQHKGMAEMDKYMADLETHMEEIEQSIQELDMFVEDAYEPLNQVNKVFNMGINFEQEWKAYLAYSTTV